MFDGLLEKFHPERGGGIQACNNAGKFDSERGRNIFAGNGCIEVTT